MKPVLFCFLLMFSFGLRAEGNALAEAMPGITDLSAESCTAKQSELLTSLGLGEMACSLSKHISLDSLGKALGVSAFQANSRTNPLAPSDNVEDFVRYSPAFFNRVNELYMKDPDIFVYDFMYRHLLANSARLFYLNGKYLRDRQQLAGLTLDRYKLAVKDPKKLYQTAGENCRKLHAERFQSNAAYAESLRQCGKSGTATTFWYRRQLDGSGEAFYTLLDNVVKTRDPEFHRRLNTK